MTLFPQEQRGQGGVPGALPLPVPWTLLSCPSYQGPGQAHYLSQGHVVVANYPYAVCATIISMRLSAEQTERETILAQWKSQDLKLRIPAPDPIPHKTPLQRPLRCLLVRTRPCPINTSTLFPGPHKQTLFAQL